MIRRTAALLVLTALSVGCRRRHRPPVITHLAAPIAAGVAAPPAAPEAPTSPDELLPGPLSAYGLVLPLGAHFALEGDGARMFHVDASMTQVMRYLQRRLSFHDADILPLGAMIRSARPTDSEGSVDIIVDVGVRDEGMSTFVTVWNRAPVQRPAQTMADGLRSSGIDPATGAPLPQN